MNIPKTGCESELTGTQIAISSHILPSQVEDILLFSQIQEALADLAENQEKAEKYDMQIVPRNDIEAYFGSERLEFFESQRNIFYPAKLVQALESLYDEYDEAFKKLIEKNMESSLDYVGEGVLARKNYCVQIDMVGLPKTFLEKVEQGHYSDTVLREVLRRRIFEIENSLAAYSLLRNLDSSQSPSDFENGLNSLIESLRAVTRRKVILLTLSEEKYRAVLEFDAGIPEGAEKDVEKIRRNTGFDDIYGPAELQIAYKKGEDNLYYVRASLEKERLKNPNGSFENALLSDEEIRRYVKQRAITYNIDAPDGNYERVINDSKEYMPDLGMGYIIESLEDIYTSEYRDFLQQKQKIGSFAGIVFSPGFLQYLRYVGCSEEEILSGNIEFHIKPLKCAYGAYGHISGDLRESEKRAKIKKELTKRKKCIVQIRMKNTSCLDCVSGREFIYIDRIFLYRNATTQKIQYMGGFRNHMPVDSQDGKKGIVHGSTQTVYAPIASDFNSYR